MSLNNSDSRLISLCQQVQAIEAGFAGETGDVCEVAVDKQYALVRAMCEIKAVTSAGHLARARALRAIAPDLCDEPSEDIADMLVAAMVRDLVAGRGVAA